LLVGAPKYAAAGETYAPGGVYKCEINNNPNCNMINDIGIFFTMIHVLVQ
jgi:hypothetical protein